MDGTVYVRPSVHDDERISPSIRRYHTDQTCQHAGSASLEVDREMAERRGLSICQRCADGGGQLGGGHGGYTAALANEDVTELTDIADAISDGGDA